MTVPVAPSVSLAQISGIHSGTAVANDVSPISGLYKEKNDLGPPSAYLAVDSNTTSNLILPPQSPSLPSAADACVAIAGHSSPETIAEHPGDDSSDPSRYQYDMV
jgi:hypothetical protein